MPAASPRGSRAALLAVCYVGFISLGLPDTLIGVAWPSVRDTFQLQQSHVAWIFVGGGCSYFVSSFFAGRLLRLFKVGMLLTGSSALVALSGFNHGLAVAWPWFVLGALLHGLGSGAIDAGLNHYVATHFSARQMNWLHASYSFGAMLGPIVMTACITMAGSWRAGYLLVAAAVCVLVLLFLATRKRWQVSQPVSGAAGGPADDLGEALHEPPSLPHAGSTHRSGVAPTVGRALRHRLVRLNVLLFFVYGGLEVALGQWSFTVVTESRSVRAEVAGAWVTIYWASILAGRVGFGFIIDRMSIDRLLRISLVTSLLGAGLFTWNPFALSAPIALALCGLGLAVIFPCLMTRTPERVGDDLAGHAIGLQVSAAMLGAAALPSACGLIAQHGGLDLVPPALFIAATALLLVHELLVRATRQHRALPME